MADLDLSKYIEKPEEDIDLGQYADEAYMDPEQAAAEQADADAILQAQKTKEAGQAVMGPPEPAPVSQPSVFDEYLKTPAEAFVHGAEETIFGGGAEAVYGAVKGPITWGAEQAGKAYQKLRGEPAPEPHPLYMHIENAMKEWDQAGEYYEQEAPTATMAGKIAPIVAGGGTYGVARAALRKAAPGLATKAATSKGAGMATRAMEVGGGYGLEKYAESGGDVEELGEGMLVGGGTMMAAEALLRGGGKVVGPAAKSAVGAAKWTGKKAFPLIAEAISRSPEKVKHLVMQHAQRALGDRWANAAGELVQKNIRRVGFVMSNLKQSAAKARESVQQNWVKTTGPIVSRNRDKVVDGSGLKNEFLEIMDEAGAIGADGKAKDMALLAGSEEYGMYAGKVRKLLSRYFPDIAKGEYGAAKTSSGNLSLVDAMEIKKELANLSKFHKGASDKLIRVRGLWDKINKSIYDKVPELKVPNQSYGNQLEILDDATARIPDTADGMKTFANKIWDKQYSTVFRQQFQRAEAMINKLQTKTGGKPIYFNKLIANMEAQGKQAGILKAMAPESETTYQFMSGINDKKIAILEDQFSRVAHPSPEMRETLNLLKDFNVAKKVYLDGFKMKGLSLHTPSTWIGAPKRDMEKLASRIAFWIARGNKPITENFLTRLPSQLKTRVEGMISKAAEASGPAWGEVKDRSLVVPLAAFFKTAKGQNAVIESMRELVGIEEQKPEAPALEPGPTGVKKGGY